MTGNQRYVISARIVGGLHREKPKLKTFMVSVLWSDESEVIIYRSFQDFKKFHGQLKRKFPNFNPFRKNDRMIPKFTGKARRSSLKQKGSKKSVRQMMFLESYCDRLLKCDQTVTLSPEVTRFFTPKDHDLQTDFTKNTVMILMSGDVQDGRGGEGAPRHQLGNVTHPFVTQTYRCVAPYETKDTKNRPFKVAADEKLDVLIKDPAGWWLVESEDKRLAWFPAPFLELSEGEDDDDEEFLGGSLYCAVRTYSTSKADEVAVFIGSVVEVLRKSDDGWWLIRFNGKVGYIPSMYLQPYTNPRAGLHGSHRHHHSSSLNLATTRESRPSQSERINEESRSDQGSRRQSAVPERLPRAQSLDVLSETWLHSQTEQDTPTSHSTDSIFSSFSSSSEEREEGQDHTSEPDSPQTESPSRSSSPSSGSTQSTGSETASVAPKVPPRPKTQEILTRCSTMTRKAALANKTRLQVEEDTIHSRM
ncbi:PREDICTED: NADPH oxidase organizer 1-like [Cyprinodon variegatus]|uniref:NADPH oxidase organizer 1b n=1 Tax=Cyprinodon variegatus TaxID=28743 RepID=A0A3Q2DHR9_CYPVA|nr:PREDICTED: NADPH oxidase organizer 1-like [Cyprinodon variegatus]